MRKIYLSLLVLFALISNSWANPNLSLTSPVFKDGQRIPDKYTCNGSNINPPLKIKHVPKSAKTLVLIIHSPDSPKGDAAHWAVYEINPKTKIIPANSIPGYQVLNDFNEFKYQGPCPTDDAIHHYIFELYAINTNFTLNENGSVFGLQQQIENNIVDKTKLTGIYQNAS